MGSAAKATVGVGIEATQSGMLQLLTPTPISGLPASLSTPIPAGQKMRIAIYVMEHTATGTITITGTAPLTGGAVNETSTTFAIPEDPGIGQWYVTSTVFGAVNASGVTVTGLTGGQVLLFGIQDATRLFVAGTKLTHKNDEQSTVLQRGTFDEDYNLVRRVFKDEWETSTDFYADEGLWLLFGGYAGSSVITRTTLPNPGVAVLASTSVVTSGSVSAALQPSAPGMVLQCIIGGAPATAATVSVTGINIYGEHITETIVPSTKNTGTFYSDTAFQSIDSNGIVYGAFGGSATLTINGFYGFLYSGAPQDVLDTFSLLNYDSTGTFVAPFCLVNEWAYEFGMEKEAKLSGKGPTQLILPVGDMSNAANQGDTFAQPTAQPSAGWQNIVYIDDLSGSFGGTANPDWTDGKVTITTNYTPRYTGWSIVPIATWNRAYRKRRKIALEMTFDMTAATYNKEYRAFVRRQTRLLRVEARGQYNGTVSGTRYYLGSKFDLPLKWLDVPERDFTTGTESVILKLKASAKVQPSLGYSHNISWVSRYGGW